MRRLRDLFDRSFLLRWTLANMLGWTLGLFLAAWTLRSPLICLNGALAAACIGGAQWLALRRQYGVAGRWALLTALGGALGVLPVVVLALTLIFGAAVFAALLGLCFGAAVGAAQAGLLPGGERAAWWPVACGAGGAACGLLVVTPVIGGLPLGLLAGAALYGLITGRALEWIAAPGYAPPA